MNLWQHATNVVAHRKLCGHEAGHCAAALVLGLDVREARADFHDLSRPPDDPDKAAGFVLIPTPDPDDPDAVRQSALAILAGPIEDGQPDWPPPWPMSLAPLTSDEDLVGRYVGMLGLDRKGYGELVKDAFELVTSREYDRLHQVVSDPLEQGHVLDERALVQVKAIVERNHMDHITLKAVATPTTDQGVFEAVISTETIDREKDVVSAAAMVAALRRWNRPVPLAWGHSTKAEDIFGSIDPTTVREVGGEVVAQGQVDLDSEVGREAWRSFKARTIGFSFGYLVPEGGATKRSGGGRHITALDVFEVTATPTPMNNDTRVLSTKALDDEYNRVRTKARDLMLEVLGVSDEPSTKTVEPERKATEAIQVASFEV